MKKALTEFQELVLDIANSNNTMFLSGMQQGEKVGYNKATADYRKWIKSSILFRIEDITHSLTSGENPCYDQWSTPVINLKLLYKLLEEI